MHRALRGLILLASAAALRAQAQPPQPSAGLETEWDIGVILQEISAHAGRLLPALDRVNARAWVEQGASETYARQLESSRQQAKALEDGAKALARNPEKLSQSLELFFRIEGLEAMLGSLEDGIRKYQSPESAQAMAALVAQNGANRERFRRYIVNLADEREKQLDVMDREAQRCRAMMAAPPTPARSSGRK
jgi:hypothetical protein